MPRRTRRSRAAAAEAEGNADGNAKEGGEDVSAVRMELPADVDAEAEAEDSGKAVSLRRRTRAKPKAAPRKKTVKAKKGKASSASTPAGKRKAPSRRGNKRKLSETKAEEGNGEDDASEAEKNEKTGEGMTEIEKPPKEEIAEGQSSQNEKNAVVKTVVKTEKQTDMETDEAASVKLKLERERAEEERKKRLEEEEEKEKARKIEEEAELTRERKAECRPDHSPMVQRALGALFAGLANDRREEVGAGEAELLDLEDNDGKEMSVNLPRELDESTVDASTFDENDKCGNPVRTLDNFSVYSDLTGKPLNLLDLWVKPYLADEMVVFGTVVAPLRHQDKPLVRVARCPPPGGDHSSVIDILEFRMQKYNAKRSKKEVESSEQIRVPGYDPQISRVEAFSRARELLQQHPVPVEVGLVKVIEFGQVELTSGFHDEHRIYPVGFKSERAFFDVLRPGDMAVYTSEIVRGAMGPRFRVAHESGKVSFEGDSPQEVWQKLLQMAREAMEKVQLPTKATTTQGAEMFGLSNPKISSLIEGLEGSFQCAEYVFIAQRQSKNVESAPRRPRQKDGAYSESALGLGLSESFTPATATGGERVGRVPGKPIGSMTVKNTQALERASAALAEFQAKEVEDLKNQLHKIYKSKVNADLLVETLAVDLVKRLRSHNDNEVAKMAKRLVKTWKEKGDQIPSRKDQLTVTDAAAHMIMNVGLESYDEVPHSVAVKYTRHARSAMRKKIFELLCRLDAVKFVSADALASTMAGKHIGRLRKHLDPDISALALSIKQRWEAQLQNPESAVYSPSPAHLLVFKKPKETSDFVYGAEAAFDPDPGNTADMYPFADSNGDHDFAHSHDGMDISSEAAFDSRRQSLKRKREPIGESYEVELEAKIRAAKRKKVEKVTQMTRSNDNDDFSSCNVAAMITECRDRPRVRVRMGKVVAIYMTHALRDPIFWLETPHARYRIAGPNVPVSPSHCYAPNFFSLWCVFESCWRVLQHVDSCSHSQDFESMVQTITQGDYRELHVRRSWSSMDLNGSGGGCVVLTREAVIGSVFYILEEVFRKFTDSKRANTILKTPMMKELVRQGVIELDEDFTSFIKAERIRLLDEAREAIKSGKQKERDAKRKEVEQQRMIENGVDLPDDLEVLAGDESHEASGEQVEDSFMAALVEKEKTSARPSPYFAPCDTAFVEIDAVFQCEKPKRDGTLDFKNRELGLFGGCEGSRSGSDLRGIRFSKLLSIWGTLQTTQHLLDKSYFDVTAFAASDFATFRTKVAETDLNALCTALVKFLCEEAGSESDPSLQASAASGVGGNLGGAAGTQTAPVPVVPPMNPMGDDSIKKKQNRRPPQPMSKSALPFISSYVYSDDQALPASANMIDVSTWPEVARRLLVYKLRSEEDKYVTWQLDPENQHPGYPPRENRDLTIKVLLEEPDLMSTCDAILEELMEDISAPLFSVPITEEEAPHYFHIIKRPMDLSTVLERLRSGHYDPSRAPEGNAYKEVIDWKRGIVKTKRDDGDSDGDEKSNKLRDEEGGSGSDSEESQGGRVVYEDQHTMDARFFAFDCLGSGHEGLAADVRLVFRNARKFNKSSTKIYSDARKLDGIFAKLYEERVIARDSKYHIPFSIRALQQQELLTQGGDNTSRRRRRLAKKLGVITAVQNTEDFVGPFQKGLPLLQEVLLALKKHDFALLSIDERIVLLHALSDLVLDSKSVRAFIQKHAESIQHHVRNYQKYLRDDQRRERELAGRPIELKIHKEAMERRRVDLENKLRTASVRMDCLGRDRFQNRFWIFEPIAFPLLMVEIVRTGRWGFYHDPEDVEKVIDSLDVRGARENDLKRNLEGLWKSHLRERMVKEKEVAKQRADEYIENMMGGEGDNYEKVINMVRSTLMEEEKKLARAAEVAKTWRAVENAGRVYYYHVETRETTWDVPDVHRAEQQQKRNVEQCRKELERAKSNPGEALDALKKEFTNDGVLVEALMCDPVSLKPNLSESVLVEKESEFIEASRVRGFVAGVLDALALLLALESFTVGQNATLVLANPSKAEEWKTEEREKWLKQANEIIEALKVAQQDPEGTWSKVCSVMKDVWGKFFDLFVGRAYGENVHDRTSAAVAKASRHAYRWRRSLQRSSSIANFGLLLMQLQHILGVSQTAALTDSRKDSYAVLFDSVHHNAVNDGQNVGASTTNDVEEQMEVDEEQQQQKKED